MTSYSSTERNSARNVVMLIELAACCELVVVGLLCSAKLSFRFECSPQQAANDDVFRAGGAKETAAADFAGNSKAGHNPNCCCAVFRPPVPHACNSLSQRSEEIQAVEPKMAYYCRLYAIKKVCSSRAMHSRVASSTCVVQFWDSAG